MIFGRSLNQKPEASELSCGRLQIAGRERNPSEEGCQDNLWPKFLKGQEEVQSSLQILWGKGKAKLKVTVFYCKVYKALKRWTNGKMQTDFKNSLYLSKARAKLANSMQNYGIWKMGFERNAVNLSRRATGTSLGQETIQGILHTWLPLDSVCLIWEKKVVRRKEDWNSVLHRIKTANWTHGSGMSDPGRKDNSHISPPPLRSVEAPSQPCIERKS